MATARHIVWYLFILIVASLALFFLFPKGIVAQTNLCANPTGNDFLQQMETAVECCDVNYGTSSYPVRNGGEWSCVGGSAQPVFPSGNVNDSGLDIGQRSEICKRDYGQNSYVIQTRDGWQCVGGNAPQIVISGNVNDQGLSVEDRSAICARDYGQNSYVIQTNSGWQCTGGNAPAPVIPGNVNDAGLEIEDRSAICQRDFGAGSYVISTQNGWQCVGGFAPPVSILGQVNDQNLSIANRSEICVRDYGQNSYAIQTRDGWQCVGGTAPTIIISGNVNDGSLTIEDRSEICQRDYGAGSYVVGSFNNTWQCVGGNAPPLSVSGDINDPELTIAHRSAICATTYGQNSYVVRINDGQWQCVGGTAPPLIRENVNVRPEVAGNVNDPGLTIAHRSAICARDYGQNSYVIRTGTEIWNCVGGNAPELPETTINNGSSSPNSIGNNGASCSGSANLTVNGLGRVLPGMGANRVRQAPSTGASQVGNLPENAIFSVLGGPECADSHQWWLVSYQGLQGWTAAGSGSVTWLEPVTSSNSSESGGNSNPPNNGGDNNPPPNTQTGQMYIDGYCQSLGYSGSNSVRTNANSWYCQDGSRTMSISNMNDVCRHQYGDAMPVAEASNPNDSYTWYCRNGENNLPLPESVNPPDGEFQVQSDVESLTNSWVTPTDTAAVLSTLTVTFQRMENGIYLRTATADVQVFVPGICIVTISINNPTAAGNDLWRSQFYAGPAFANLPQGRLDVQPMARVVNGYEVELGLILHCVTLGDFTPEDDVDSAINLVQNEIDRHGGNVESATYTIQLP